MALLPSYQHNSLPQLSGYTPTKPLYSSPKIIVYQAIQESQGRTVVIKLLRDEYLTLRQQQLLRNEYKITKNLLIPGIVHAASLELRENSYALVMEDYNSIALRDYVKQFSLSLVDTLKIAIQLSEILHNLYQCRIIHKNINPGNIIIHPQSKQVRLIDFGMASLLSYELQALNKPNSLEGTLSYLAPEQTGRMNRGIDYRTDFYSLGVTLYELATGRLPFLSMVPLELVHCHLAQIPKPLHHINESIPPIVSQIVHKLMAKNAEDRYQSSLGLKYDLENCLHQVQTTQKIEPFEIGQEDISNRFLISEKLYGRELEVQCLLNTFDRVTQGNSEIMLVSGCSGIGKTTVINEVHKPITRQKGYFIQGKFDQFHKDRPFSAFVQAFRGLIEQLIGESEAELTHWRTKILSALGDSGQVITDVIPELECIVGPQPPTIKLSGGAEQNRFNLLFGKFVRLFTKKEHPLVIFLDDLQWADSASLSLIQLLMDESEAGYLLLLGAYRDNEVYPAHPLIRLLDTLREDGKVIHTMMLSLLTKGDITDLITDTMMCPSAVSVSLSELIHRKTKGNPFFTIQFIKGLHRDNNIYFNSDMRCWQCDLSAVQQLSLTDNVVQFMVSRLQKLPQDTQTVLKLSACIGNNFDLETLAIICEEALESVNQKLWISLQEGFILSDSSSHAFYLEGNDTSDGEYGAIRYRFLHDRIQQAAYTLIPDNQKQSTHLQIGRLLLQGFSQRQKEEQLFSIVNQFNLGRNFISSPQETLAVAKLNLQAGQKAKASSAYEVAAQYYSMGIDCLSEKVWQTDYSLMFQLHYAGAEATYLCGNFEQAETLYALAIDHSQTALDKAMIYRVQMTQYQLQGRNKEAIAIQRQSLELLGWPVPKNDIDLDAALKCEIEAVVHFLNHNSIQSIIDLPIMQNENVAEMLRILQVLFYAAWLDGQSKLAYLALAKMTTISLQHGNSDMSPFGYVGFGLIANTLLGNAAMAYHFGATAVALCDQFDNADICGMTNFLFAADVHSWSRPLKEADVYYEEALRQGMQAGNWLTVSFTMMLSSSDRLTYGQNLEELYQTAQAHSDFLYRIKSLENRDALIVGVIQPIRHLLGLTTTVESFDDTSFNEASFCHKYDNSPYHLAWFYSVKIRHAYLFDQQDIYADLISKLSIIEDTIPSHAKVPSSVFYAALMHLSIFEVSNNKEVRKSHWQEVLLLEKKLKEWEQDCPENISHKCLLVQAEKLKLSGQYADAIDSYEQAIAQSRAQHCLYEEALANELAARFYLNWDKKKAAVGYLQDAYDGYKRWGAKAKLNHLEQRYPNLLKTNFYSVELLGKDQGEGYSTLSIKQGIESLLDIPTILNAAQAISQEIEFGKLLTTLMNLVIANAGAQVGHLLLYQNNQWTVVVEATPNQVNRIDISLEHYLGLPKRLVYSVIRTQEKAVFEFLSADEQFVADPYILTQKPKSVLCIPVKLQNKTIGVLYLENNLMVGAFTDERVEVLQFLASQAAISIENARLYQQAENYSQKLEKEVEQKTQDLHRKANDLQQTLQTLQQTQAHLIHAEKMSSLGQLVAGISHEINNPVGFIMGNVPHLQDYIKDLQDLFHSYQDEYSQPSPSLQSKINAIEPDDIFLDINSILDSIEVGSERINEIVQSLRNFSRLDQAAVKAVNLHSGIESTLLVLNNRLQALGEQPEIRITRQYTQLPKVVCYPNQLNQVFLNIINNAIDAIRENTCVDDTPEIRIRTEQALSGKVKIIISNTNSVIPEQLQKQIFEPFFTTKPVGQGKGLGLFVSYSIIRKHAGTLTVNSAESGTTDFEIILPQNNESLKCTQATFL
ncbi:MAG: AAA family ATPase [Cyanobacteria bacterium P01_D01_bin.156]